MVQVFWFLVSSFWFLVNGSEFLVNGSGFLVSDFWFLVSGVLRMVPGFRCWASVSTFRFYGLWFRVKAQARNHKLENLTRKHQPACR